MPKKRVLILTTNPLHNAPRVIRETNSLIGTCDITAVGTTPPHLQEITFRHADTIAAPLTDKLIRKAYHVLTGKQYPSILPGIQKRFHALIAEVNPDVIIVHNPIHLPYVFSFPDRRYKVIYNAHEYHPLEFDNDPRWLKTWGRYFYNIYSKYLSQVDLLINVCEAIAKKCEYEFGKSSIVIPNATIFHQIEPCYNTEGQIRIIHHGVALEERKIELMIEALNLLGEDYSLDLMLVPSQPAYYERLQGMAAATNNIKLIEPVKFDDIVPFINKYDIGMFNLPPLNYNYEVALPNKLFEFIQARLCIAISPSVEMKYIVNKYDLGVVGEDYTAEAMANAVRKLTREDINRFKQNAVDCAYAVSAEQYQQLFLNAVKEMNAPA